MEDLDGKEVRSLETSLAVTGGIVSRNGWAWVGSAGRGRENWQSDSLRAMLWCNSSILETKYSENFSHNPVSAADEDCLELLVWSSLFATVQRWRGSVQASSSERMWSLRDWLMSAFARRQAARSIRQTISFAAITFTFKSSTLALCSNSSSR